MLACFSVKNIVIVLHIACNAYLNLRFILIHQTLDSDLPNPIKLSLRTTAVDNVAKVYAVK